MDAYAAAKRRHALCAIATTGLLISGLSPASADTAASADTPGGIETIIVTAQKTAQDIETVPLTLSALSGNQLASHNYYDLEDFKGLVPGLNVNNYAGEARVNIRGIGMNSLSFGVDSQVAVNLNDVYLSSARAADQAFLDVDRIEVLRGPQGTLYGRNATGGAINIITKLPTDQSEGYAQIDLGNYNQVGTQLVVSGPLLDDTVLGRFAFSSENHDGYSLNLYNGKRYDNANTITARGSLVFNIADNVSLDVIADYHQENDGNNADHLFGKSPGFPVMTGVFLGGKSVPLDADGQAIDPRLLSVNTAPENKQQVGGVVANLTWKLNDILTVKSITAYRQENVRLTLDFDQTTTPFPTPAVGKDFEAYEGEAQTTEELQLLGDLGWVNWVTGFFYMHDDVDPAFFYDGVNFGAPTAPFLAYLQLGGTTVTNAYALFGQATFKITDKLNFTAGVRYSYEDRASTSLQIIPVFDSTTRDAKAASFHDVSPKFTVDYQWWDGLMTFFTVSKGFQSGGFDISASPPLVAFQPEIVWDYEGGVKYYNDWLAVDLSAYHYDYTNLQVAQIVNGLPTTTNAASSQINGVELSATVEPAAGLSLTETFAYTDAYFTQFVENDTLTGLPVNLAGNQLPGAPKLSSNFTAQYTVPFDGGDHLDLVGEWNWHDRLYYSEFNSDQISQGPVSTFNASARYTFDDGNWSAEIYGKNLSNALIKSQVWITGAGYGAMAQGQLAPPLTFGGRVRYAF
jgi:iron complex outermembrane receptor protein